jgi:TRAP-type C4-dicarboxylate transport system permease small subunit
MLNIIQRIGLFGAWVGGGLMLAVAFVVSVEVVLRWGFSIGWAAASELSSYALAIGAAWGFTYALTQRAHVRVDAAVRLLPARLLLLVDFIAMLALATYAFLMVRYGWFVFWESWSRDAVAPTPLQTPIWIPQGLWWLGLLVFLVACIATLAIAALHLLRGRDNEARALIGTVTAVEEAESEIREAKKLVGEVRG